MALVTLKLSGLWLHANFRKLWAGQAASIFGTSLTNVALPLTAVMFLQATPIQMGIIGAIRGVPAIIGLFLGVWVDRRPRGPILVSVDFGRMLLLLSVPVAYAVGQLSIELLYVVALGIGAMSMLFEIAYRSFLPSLVRKTELVEANSKLELANSGAEAIGPGLGGLLIELVVAPFAVIASAIMYLVSAIMFRSLRLTESISSQLVDSNGERESMLAGIKTGFTFFRKSRPLLGTTTAASTLVLFGEAYETLYILYLVRNLEFTPGMIGLIFSLGSIGIFTASFISSWLTDRIGVGPTLILGFVIMTIGGFLVPLAEGSRAVVYMIVVLGEVSFVLGVIIWNIGHVSLRQSITPESLLGRVTSLQIVSSRAVTPLGAIIGGVLGELMGLRQAIFLFAGGMTAGVVWLFVFGVWKIREMPEN